MQHLLTIGTDSAPRACQGALSVFWIAAANSVQTETTNSTHIVTHVSTQRCDDTNLLDRVPQWYWPRTTLRQKKIAWYTHLVGSAAGNFQRISFLERGPSPLPQPLLAEPVHFCKSKNQSFLKARTQIASAGKRWNVAHSTSPFFQFQQHISTYLLVYWNALQRVDKCSHRYHCHWSF